MKMPVLSPLPIRTKGKGFFRRIWIWMTEVRAWKVVKDWEYQLPDGTYIVVPKGFIFDGASIPRPLWGLLSPTGLLLIPGLIHDFGYRYDYLWGLDDQNNVFKKYENAGQHYWDNVFYEVGLAVNGMKIINFLAWISLALMGRFAWNANRKKHERELCPLFHHVVAAH